MSKKIEMINYENYEAYKQAVVANDKESQNKYFALLPTDLRNSALEFLKGYNHAKQSNQAARMRNERTEIFMRKQMGIDPKNIN